MVMFFHKLHDPQKRDTKYTLPRSHRRVTIPAKGKTAERTPTVGPWSIRTLNAGLQVPGVESPPSNLEETLQNKQLKKSINNTNYRR